jgi:predicted nucleotidyltransferase
MLIPKGREKVIRVFYDEPYKELYVKEVAELSNSPFARAHQYLNEYASMRLLHRRETKRRIYFKANLNEPKLLKIFEYLEVLRREDFFSKNRRFERVLNRFLQTLISGAEFDIHLVGLFGSLARGEWIRESDIDILVVTANHLSKNETIPLIEKAKRTVSGLYHLAPVSLTVSRYKESAIKNNAFFQNFWNDRIILYNEFLFWQLIPKRMAE